MTYRVEDSALERVFELLAEEGFDGMSQALAVLLNEMMKVERSAHLQAGPYERSDRRQGYANGFKPKRVRTRIGELELDVPQTRASDFYPSCLEKGLKSERALRMVLAEAYVQGVSTRKMAKLTQELCGIEVSSSEVSRAAKALDETLSAWRNRSLEAVPYAYLDARYEKVRHGGQVVDCAILLAIGVDRQGKRSVLGVSVALSEQEVHWREFLASLKDRGLHGIELFISDAHEGLKAARKAVFPSVPWQRCQFHVQQNAQKYVPRQALKREVAEAIRGVFNALNRQEAERQLDMLIKAYQDKAPKLAEWAAKAIPEALTVFAFPEAHPCVSTSLPTAPDRFYL
ncbi:MAG: IS256 family transposase [Xanthomonadales bacterium]|nr:IS256 family transposase [Xanthomonadales bacterium]